MRSRYLHLGFGVLLLLDLWNEESPWLPPVSRDAGMAEKICDQRIDRVLWRRIQRSLCTRTIMKLNHRVEAGRNPELLVSRFRTV